MENETQPQQDSAPTPIYQPSEDLAPASNPWKMVAFVSLVVSIGLVGFIVFFLQSQKTVVTPTMLPATIEPLPSETPVSDSMEGWQTHTNTEYNFSIDYPPNWKVTQNSLPDFKSTVFPGKMKYYVELQDSNNLTSIQILPEGEIDAGVEDATVGIANVGKLSTTTYSYTNGLVVYTKLNNTKLPDFKIHVKPQSELTDQILSTFTFTDTTSAKISPARTIAYAKIPNWNTTSSPTGFSFQHPTWYTMTMENKLNASGSCVTSLSNNAGGILSVSLSSYTPGTDLKKLITEESSYTYRYEDVLIQGKKSLLVEKGPTGESGTGNVVIIPVGNIHLRVSAGPGEFEELLKGLQIPSTLDLSKCE